MIAFVARSITTNGRDLDGAVNRLLAHSTLSQTPLTIEAAEAAIRDLVREIADACGFGGRIEWDATKPDGQPRRSLDISRARTLLGWEPKVDFKTGLAATVEWWRAQSPATASA